ncbi:MAG: hypothetical protein ABI227_01440 [Rhodanobacter sp.]
MKLAWIAYALLLLSCSASAEIEKIALTCEAKICFYWWPKLPEVKGWHQDREQSYKLGANVLVPNGSTFSNAETVLYAEALYKPRITETRSVNDLIASDREEFLKNKPGIIVIETRGLITGDGKVLRSFTYFPTRHGDWEQVSYGEEDDFYLIFTVSSRTKAAYDKSVVTYQTLISGYKETP